MSWSKCQKLDCFMVDNKQKAWYYSKPSADCQKKFNCQYLISMITYISSLVTNIVGYLFKY